jgi:hypothetical protein
MRHALAGALTAFRISASAVHAQTGSVTGTLVDDRGGVVFGATVTLSSASGRQATTTGAMGQYRFTNVGG